MSVLISVLFGALIGISLGSVGGGGSILAVPALVYALGQTAPAATTGSLVIVGITAVSGVASYAYASHVRWGTGIAFGVTGIVSSLIGTHLNSSVNPRLLLATFSLVMIMAAVGMLRRNVTDHAGPPHRFSDHSVTHESGSALVTSDGYVVHQNAAIAPRPGKGTELNLSGSGWIAHADRTVDGIASRRIRVVVVGLSVGFLTGFFGVGGGFVVVPALTLILRFPMLDAIGTSLLVIAMNSATALTARIGGSETIDWAVIVPFALAAVAGAALGKLVADKVGAVVLRRAFGTLMIVTAVYMGVHNLLFLL